MVNINAIAEEINFGLGLLASFASGVDVVGIYANGSGGAAGVTGQLNSSIINSLVGNTGPVAAFGQMFENARPLKALIRDTSKVMQHPVETGVILSDHHVINPVEIDIPMLISSEFYSATYAQMRQAFNNATLLSVKTRVGVFSNMIIADMPHEEDPDMFDVITIGLHLMQVIYIIPGTTTPVQNFQPIDPLNTGTISSGLQSAAVLGMKLLAGASSVASYAAVARRGIL